VPAIGGDLDELTVGVGEIEEDFLGSGGRAAGVDAGGDADVAAIGIAGGLGVEVMEDGAKGVGGGDGLVGGVALVEEPLAEGAGADGEGVTGEGWGAHGDEGASADGGEGDAAFGDAEEGVEAGGAAGWGWVIHRSNSRYSIEAGGISIFGSESS